MILYDICAPVAQTKGYRQSGEEGREGKAGRLADNRLDLDSFSLSGVVSRGVRCWMYRGREEFREDQFRSWSFGLRNHAQLLIIELGQDNK